MLKWRILSVIFVLISANMIAGDDVKPIALGARLKSVRGLMDLECYVLHLFILHRYNKSVQL